MIYTPTCLTLSREPHAAEKESSNGCRGNWGSHVVLTVESDGMWGLTVEQFCCTLPQTVEEHVPVLVC